MNPNNINLNTNTFLQAVIDLINESGLPPCNVRLALQTIVADVIEEERRQIDQEKARGESTDDSKGGE